MISHYDLLYKDGLYLDLHLPDMPAFDLFVYFHGGGLEAGNRKGVEVFAQTLAKRGIATASVEYRMYPSARFPDFIEDCAASVRWLRDHISAYGTCRRLLVGGSSAGGYISMMLCFDGRYLEAVGMKPTDVDAYIHDAGQPTTHFNVLRERGEDTRRVVIDGAAPLYFVGTAERYAPMLLIVSDDDIPCRYEQTMLLARTLRHFGHGDCVTVREMHGTHCAYDYRADEDGEGTFGKVILEYLDTLAQT